MLRRFVPWLVVGIAVVAAVLAMAFSGRSTADAQDTTVRIDPAWQNVPAGEQFTVDVWVDDVTDLGAYEFILEFEKPAKSSETRQRIRRWDHS